MIKKTYRHAHVRTVYIPRQEAGTMFFFINLTVSKTNLFPLDHNMSPLPRHLHTIYSVYHKYRIVKRTNGVVWRGDDHIHDDLTSIDDRWEWFGGDSQPLPPPPPTHNQQQSPNECFGQPFGLLKETGIIEQWWKNEEIIRRTKYARPTIVSRWKPDPNLVWPMHT